MQGGYRLLPRYYPCSLQLCYNATMLSKSQNTSSHVVIWTLGQRFKVLVAHNFVHDHHYHSPIQNLLCLLIQREILLVISRDIGSLNNDGLPLAHRQRTMSRTPSPHFPTLEALIEHLSADPEREELAAELGGARASSFPPAHALISYYCAQLCSRYTATTPSAPGITAHHTQMTMRTRRGWAKASEGRPDTRSPSRTHDRAHRGSHAC